MTTGVAFLCLLIGGALLSGSSVLWLLALLALGCVIGWHAAVWWRRQNDQLDTVIRGGRR